MLYPQISKELREGEGVKTRVKHGYLKPESPDRGEN